jgi:hypothetical protein
MITVYATWYGWFDNSPAGNAIAYPKIHQGAGGTGTYADPITFATDQSEAMPGTVVYVPAFLKYFIMEDDCVACDSDWQTGMKYHFDFWLNTNATCNQQDSLNCEDMWTRSATTVEIGPPPDRMVDPAPLFDTTTNVCRATP